MQTHKFNDDLDVIRLRNGYDRRRRRCDPHDYELPTNYEKRLLRQNTTPTPSHLQPGHDLRMAIYSARAELGLPLF